MKPRANTKLTAVQEEYKALAKKREPARPVFMNCLRAFVVGGIICTIGQIIQEIFIHWFGFDKITAGSPTVAVLILVSVILTSLGLYDKIGQWGGAGAAVPVTGFANAMASAAIEHRSEGLVLGVAAKMFKIAGAVVVFGTVAAFIIGVLHLIFNPKMGGGF